MQEKGDKPRKIIVCHPDRYLDVQVAVAKLGYGDVLVQPNHHIADVNGVFILDPALIDGVVLPPGSAHNDPDATR